MEEVLATYSTNGPLDTVLRILDYGRKTNSYKFALLRAFAEVGHEGADGTSIGFERIARRFLKYYWPLTLRFRVRQATDPTRDPVIMRFIREEGGRSIFLLTFRFNKTNESSQVALGISLCAVAVGVGASTRSSLAFTPSTEAQ